MPNGAARARVGAPVGKVAGATFAFGGIVSIVAVGFVTWMVSWMRRASRTIAGDLQGKMSSAVELRAIGVFTAALLAVGREGLETA